MISLICIKINISTLRVYPCTDIHSCGDKVHEDRSSGADCEHRQPAKTINAEPQNTLRQQKHMNKLTLKIRTVEQDSNAITHILQQNKEVEFDLLNLYPRLLYSNFLDLPLVS